MSAQLLPLHIEMAPARMSQQLLLSSALALSPTRGVRQHCATSAHGPSLEQFVWGRVASWGCLHLNTFGFAAGECFPLDKAAVLVAVGGCWVLLGCPV